MTVNYKMRITVLFFGIFSLYVLLLVHLFIIQKQRGDYFTELGKNQYGFVLTNLADRGHILDRYAKPLTLNKTYFSAFIVPSKITNYSGLKKFLDTYYPDAAKRLSEHGDAHFLYVKRHINDCDRERIQASKLEDICLLKDSGRFYPHESFAPIIGITDIDNSGVLGLEMIYDSVLAGKPKQYFLEKDARSGHFYFNRELTHTGALGQNIQLTLDSVLQVLVYGELQAAVEQLNAQEAAALVLDPVSGDILVMSQYPAFDPNNRQAIDLEKSKNKIISQAYELGSVMKIFLALAALEENVVTPDEIIDCQNTKSAYVDGLKINTVVEHGKITFSEVIELSNNIGTSKVALRLGPSLYEHYKRCGFGERTGLYGDRTNLSGEQAGFVNHPSNWSRRSVLSLSFGYESRATLLQLARAFSVIVNGGYLITPRFICSHNKNNKLKTKIYSQKTLDIMRDILQNTILKGTGRRARIENYTVLGKTGTACLLVDGVYDNEKNIYTFVGSVEKDDYKRVIVTFVKEVPQKRARACAIAAPLFDKIARKMLIHDKII